MWQTEHTHDTAAAPEHVWRFRHRVERHGGGSRIVVTVEAEGPDADTIGPAVASDLPESVAALAAAAEAQALPA
jgi:hypothetical protein